MRSQHQQGYGAHFYSTDLSQRVSSQCDSHYDQPPFARRSARASRSAVASAVPQHRDALFGRPGRPRDVRGMQRFPETDWDDSRTAHADPLPYLLIQPDAEILRRRAGHVPCNASTTHGLHDKPDSPFAKLGRMCLTSPMTPSFSGVGVPAHARTACSIVTVSLLRSKLHSVITPSPESGNTDLADAYSPENVAHSSTSKMWFTKANATTAGTVFWPVICLSRSTW